MAKSSQSAKTLKNKSTVRNSRTTVSGPAEPDASGAGDILAEKASFPFNPNKAAEYDPDAAVAPPEGASVKPADSIVGASTVTELNGSHKVGSGSPNIGKNPTVGPLDRMRVDSTDRLLTTNQGVPVGDNQNSLKAGLRGPTLLEDFKTALAALADRLTNEGAVPRFVSSALGPIQPAAGNAFEVDVTMEAAPTVLYDALVLPMATKPSPPFALTDEPSNSSRTSTATASRSSRWAEASNCSVRAASTGRCPTASRIQGSSSHRIRARRPDDFVAAISTHRHFARETHPPRV